MEFSNFYNIKTEQVGAWNPPPGPHAPERQKVNPFMQAWAVASISGIYLLLVLLLSCTCPACGFTVFRFSFFKYFCFGAFFNFFYPITILCGGSAHINT